MCNEIEMKRFLPKWDKRKNGLLQRVVAVTVKVNSSPRERQCEPLGMEADRPAHRSQPRHVEGATSRCSRSLSLGFPICTMGIRGFW